MQPFDYAVPATAEQAVRLLGTRGAAGRPAVPVAGGSDLLALVKDGVLSPGRLVDLSGLDGLAEVAVVDDSLVLGALAPLADLAAHREVAARQPALARALSRVASPQIRHVGTLGGNLCQRPRCWYFRRGYGLLAQLDGVSMPVAGDNRYHAILGTGGAAGGPAYFVSPSTVAPLLVALGAEVRAAGPGGGRTVPLSSLYRVPRRPEEGEIALAPAEIVTHVVVPPARGARAASYEVRQRRSLDWSLATAAVVLRLDGERVEEARVVLGQVAPVPWRCEAAERWLVGRVLDAETMARAGEEAVAGAQPLSRNGYKVQLARTAVARALTAVLRGGAAATAPAPAPSGGAR
ncbi:MAG TPA: FAD binding domain-containing protein [Thermoanaerobaculia bacterium]|nr:FAD binding domain-containing protein [Thermoanaerobaculia bacterium]